MSNIPKKPCGKRHSATHVNHNRSEIKKTSEFVTRDYLWRFEIVNSSIEPSI